VTIFSSPSVCKNTVAICHEKFLCFKWSAPIKLATCYILYRSSWVSFWKWFKSRVKGDVPRHLFHVQEWHSLHTTPNYWSQSCVVSEVKKTSQHEHKHDRARENVREILGVLSSELPAVIQSIIQSVLFAVFSEETGRNMGKAATAYYKELKDGGLPEQVAVNMTEEYMRTFNLGYMVRSARKGRWIHDEGGGAGRQIEENTGKGLQKKKGEEE